MNNSTDYTNIACDGYFKKLQIPPYNKDLMETFLLIFDLKFIISKDVLETIIQNRSMSIDQLNALFFLAGLSNMYMLDLQQSFKNIIEDLLPSIRIHFNNLYSTDINLEFEELELGNKVVEIFSVTDFSMNLTLSFLDEISFPITYEGFVNCLVISISKMKWIYHEDESKLNEYIMSYYKKSSILQELAIKLYQTMCSKVEKISLIGKHIASICSKSGFITREEEVTLQYFVLAQEHFMENIITSENMQLYEEDAMFICSNKDSLPTEENWLTNKNANQFNINDNYFDNDNFDNDSNYSDYSNYGTEYYGNKSTKMSNYHQNGNHFSYVLELANRRLAQIDYEIVSSNKSFHSVLDCLLQHQLLETGEKIVELLHDTMAIERYTVGFTDKYSGITTEEHFFMICLANDIIISYDDFLVWMGKYKKLPYDYPIEIILRIISRIFNIRIVFFTQQLIKLDVNNSINESGIIEIYQYVPDSCFNIVKKGTTFIPLGNKIVIQPTRSDHPNFVFDASQIEETVNDINVVIEI